jgi:hypothetical protein
LFNTRLAGGDTYLLGGRSFSAGELVAIQGAFGKANLGGYEIDGARVRIPTGQQAVYMGALADAEALPMSFGDHWTRAISGSNPFESSQQQEKRLRIAKQEELGTWIREMRGTRRSSRRTSSNGPRRSATRCGSWPGRPLASTCSSIRKPS